VNLVEDDIEDDCIGIDGNFSFTEASATAAASCNIFSDSAFVVSSTPNDESLLWNV